MVLIHHPLSHLSISTIFGGWPARRIPIRNIFPAIHNAPAVLAISSAIVPIRSTQGGSAIARFIIVNGV